MEFTYILFPGNSGDRVSGDVTEQVDRFSLHDSLSSVVGRDCNGGGNCWEATTRENRLKFEKRIVESTGTRNDETRLQNEKVSKKEE